MFNNVVSTTLWEMIKKERTEQERLAFHYWEPSRFDSYPELEVNYLDKDWLSNVISTSKLRNMRSDMPMLIAAQTGSGKSTIIFSKLLKIALEENKRILYLCSRSALAIKTKENAMKDEVNGELFALIKDSNELWLVFAEDKKVGEFLQEALTISGVFLPLFFTSESDKEAAEFQKMIKEETLPYKGVITTKVLDVGINLRDKNTNVAVLSSQLVEIKQQLGRKRVNGDERVNAYFKVPSSKELAIRSRSLKKRIADINQTLFSLVNVEYINEISPPFGLKGSKIIYNPLCMDKLKMELKHTEELIDLLVGYNDMDEKALAYAKHLLPNFGGVQYVEDLLVEPRSIKLKRLLSFSYRRCLWGF